MTGLEFALYTLAVLCVGIGLGMFFMWGTEQREERREPKWIRNPSRTR